jgi:hypothetical protein
VPRFFIASRIDIRAADQQKPFTTFEGSMLPRENEGSVNARCAYRCFIRRKACRIAVKQEHSFHWLSDHTL